MDTKALKETIVKNVYHIDANKHVALHKHDKHDEIFYCIAGSGYGVLEDKNIALHVGQTFIVPAGVMHSLKTEGDLYVASFLVPKIKLKTKS